MKPYTLLFTLCLGAALSASGCHNDTEEVDKPVASTVFDGVPDAKYAGTWKTEDGVSTYKIEADGNYTVDSKIKVKGTKPILAHSSSKWGIKGDRMEFKDQSGNVASFNFDLQGNKLTLTTTGSLKGKTIMDRQP